MRNTAPPLNLPCGFASTTVPVADEPSGITVCPLTAAGSATVPENGSPELFFFDVIVSPRRITMWSPAGIVLAAAAGLVVAARVASAGVDPGAAEPDGA